MHKLDDTFQDEEAENTYSTYKKFIYLKKSPQMSMNEYILEFENLSHEMSSFNMTFPDTVLVFQILEGAGLNENQCQMALTLANDLTFKSMKGALKRVFSDKIEDENPINRPFLDVPIKQENVCYTQPSNKQKKTKYNPLTKQGIISRCAICDSKMHWAKDCQPKRIQAANIVEIDDKKEDNYEFEEVNIVLMTTENPEPLKQNELNAIIDTACTRTVAGQGQLQNYLKNLDDSLLNQVEITKSNRVFKFGDGHQVTLSSVKIPDQIGQKNCFISTEIVDENILLLLSKTSLKNCIESK